MDKNLIAPTPKVSVLMPVYNGEKFLSEAIDSILNQTFSDFEFLIINDGSTDQTEAIIESYKDKRIQAISLTRNAGVISALNIGLARCCGIYIARMDADDIALPERLEKQVTFMEKNPRIGIAGSWVQYFGNRKGITRAPLTHREILWTMLFGSPFFHPTIIMRSHVLKGTNLNYPQQYTHAEDYALWAASIGFTEFANIPEVLLMYRFTESSVSAMNKDEQRTCASAVAKSVHEKLIGRPLSLVEWSSVSIDDPGQVKIENVVNVYWEIDKKNDLFPPRDFCRKLNLRIKQLAKKKGVARSSYFWLLKNALADPRFLRYLIKF
jgi:glycosyltransferase involved in cell wall biosynthesis